MNNTTCNYWIELLHDLNNIETSEGVFHLSYTLLDHHNLKVHTQPHPIIAQN